MKPSQLARGTRAGRKRGALTSTRMKKMCGGDDTVGEASAT
eukprot:COSAG05_NODE_21688_length_270_cov_0.602339_1_plen_40_part_10